jgi:hypothetical protein
MRFASLIFLALIERSAPAADPAAEVTAADILDGWRQIERDDRTFAYEAELIEYQHAKITVGDDPFANNGVEAQLQLAKTLTLTVDGQRFVEHLRGQWPPLEPEGPLQENGLQARACDGRENREFRMNVMGPNTVQGSFITRATPEVTTYLRYASPLWLAPQPLDLLKALRCDLSRAAAKPNAAGNLEVVVPGSSPHHSIRVEVSRSVPYRPVTFQLELGGRATHSWELLPATDGGEPFRVTGWKSKQFSNERMTGMTSGTVTSFTSSPEVDDSTFALKFPVGAHIVGRTDRKEVRTYWIQGINNELRPLPREQFGRAP